MDTTTVVIILGVVGLLIGIATIYLAIWSKYGIGEKIDKGGEKIDKGFGELRISGATVARDIDKRMNELLEIIRMLVPQKGTATYKFTNIGTVGVSVIDIAQGITTYDIRAGQPIFPSKFLVAKANENKEFQEKEKALFGEKQSAFHSPIPTIMRVVVPSEDTEICAEFIAFLLEWLDTEYLKMKVQLTEAESSISKYLKKTS